MAFFFSSKEASLSDHRATKNKRQPPSSETSPLAQKFESSLPNSHSASLSNLICSPTMGSKQQKRKKKMNHASKNPAKKPKSSLSPHSAPRSVSTSPSESNSSSSSSAPTAPPFSPLSSQEKRSRSSSVSTLYSFATMDEPTSLDSCLDIFEKVLDIALSSTDISSAELESYKVDFLLHHSKTQKAITSLAFQVAEKPSCHSFPTQQLQSFASIAAKNRIVPTQKQSQKSLFIKIDKESNSTDVIDEITDKIKPSKDNIAIQKLSKINNKTVKLTVDSSANAESIISKIQSRIDGIRVEEERKLPPKVKIFAVPEKTTPDEVITQLHYHNSNISSEFSIDELKSNMKFLFAGKLTLKGNRNIVFEITPSLRTCLLKSSKVRLDYRVVKWADHLHINRCEKCLHVGQKPSDCKNKPSCARCGDQSHAKKDCPKFPNPNCHLCTKLFSKRCTNLMHDLGSKVCVTESEARKKLIQKTQTNV